MLVGARIEQQARVLRGIGGEHHDARLLDLALLLVVVIFDAGDAVAGGIREHARHVAERPHVRALAARLAETGRLRIGERPVGQPALHQPS